MQKDSYEKNKSLWASMLAGVISTAQLMAESGQRAYRPGMGRVYSKYTPAQMDAMRLRGQKVRNPKTAAHINAMHDSWYAKKFGNQAG